MTDQQRIDELEKRLKSLELAVIALATGQPIGFNEKGIVVLPLRIPDYIGL